MNIREYIQSNYEKVKNILKKEYFKRNGGDFDEDVFHDTLYKVMYIFGDGEVDDDIINYIITAFNRNTFRSKNYSYTKMRKEVEDMNSITTSIDEICDNIDVFVIIEDIRKNFGKDYAKYFVLWCRGYTINEIQLHFGVYNLYYKFSNIKKFIKLNYNEVIKGI